MSMTPNPPASLVLDRAERRVLQQIAIARSTTKRPQRNRYVIDLVATWFTKRQPTGLRQLLAMLRDTFDRDGDDAALLGVADELKAEIESWIELRRGIVRTDLATAHTTEEHCEGLQEEAEIELVYSRSPGAAARFIERARKHINAIREMMKTASTIRDSMT